MTINTAGYTVGDNRPLNHARILWQPITGTVTGDGDDPDFAANDFTAQRWIGGTEWIIETAADAPVDCVFIAAHSLAGKTLTIGTSAATAGGFTTRATVVPGDNSTICAMFNTGAGLPHTIRRLRVGVSSATGATVGIIRAGVALQMQQPFYAGHQIVGWSRVTEAQQSFSETGQWLGRMEKRRALEATYRWAHLSREWYRDNFEPFSSTLPLRPFGIAGNPSRMPEDVAWCWTDQDVRAEAMGIRDRFEVTLSVTGYAG